MKTEDIIKNILFRRGALHVINDIRFYNESSVVACINEALSKTKELSEESKNWENLFSEELLKSEKLNEEICDYQDKLSDYDEQIEGFINSIKSLQSELEAKNKEIIDLKTSITSLTFALEAKNKEIEELRSISTFKCDRCGNHPSIIYTTESGRFCINCKPKS